MLENHLRSTLLLLLLLLLVFTVLPVNLWYPCATVALR